MSKQQTLKGSFSLSGKGLHTGLQINISFHPAPAGTGRVIRRVDVEGTPEVLEKDPSKLRVEGELQTYVYNIDLDEFLGRDLEQLSKTGDNTDEK